MKPINISSRKFNEIKEVLKNSGFSADSAYTTIMGREGLFGVAYFGFKPTKYERFKTTHIWRAILFCQLEFNPNLRDWQKEGIKKFLDIKSN